MIRPSIKKALIDLNMYRPAWQVYDRLTRLANRAGMRAEIDHYARFVKWGDLCFDIGAYSGRKAAVFLELGARVVAVEPCPSLGQELKARLGGNPRLTVVQQGVADAPGTATLHVEAAFEEFDLQFSARMVTRIQRHP